MLKIQKRTHTCVVVSVGVCAHKNMRPHTPRACMEMAAKQRTPREIANGGPNILRRNIFSKQPCTEYFSSPRRSDPRNAAVRILSPRGFEPLTSRCKVRRLTNWPMAERFSNSKISAVGDLGRETQGKGPTEEGKWPQRPNISRTSKISAGNTQI